jgi:hypothetical protein
MIQRETQERGISDKMKKEKKQDNLKGKECAEGEGSTSEQRIEEEQRDVEGQRGIG